MSKSWPYPTVAGLVALFVIGAAVVWVVDPRERRKPPPPEVPTKNPVRVARPDPEPPDELALPVAQKEHGGKVVRRISVFAGGWHLDIHSGGAGQLGYGAADVWEVEPNTFDFPATLEALRSVARKKDFPGGRRYLVTFLAEGEDRPVQGYTQDGTLVLGLLDKAAGALRRRTDRFDELWKEHPPSRIVAK